MKQVFTTRFLGACGVLAVAAAASLSGQQPPAQAPSAQPPAQRATGTVRTTTTAIMVDVVVRDRRGNPITDLAPEEFEILEDGVRQDVGSVTVFTSPERKVAEPARPAAGAPKASRAVPPVPVIALVFDRLSPEARALAHGAAHKYIGESEQSEAMIGVFGIDLSLKTYQVYTRDSALLRQAVEAIGNRSTSQFASNTGTSREASERAAGTSTALGTLQAAASTGTPAAAGAAGDIGGAAAEAQFAEMQRRMLETFDVLERDQQGLATSNSLLALVNSMRTLPGRKSVIFFSEGLAIPPNVAAQFRSVVDTANRANVSIYAMDAAGLRAESTSKEQRDSVNASAARNLARNPTADVVGAAMTAALERNEDYLRMDPHSGLGQLTSETGGLLIRNTNDLTGGFRRMDEDMRNYYMLTYVPKNDQFDGKFRQIVVNVKRSGTDVAFRKGYFAVREAGATPVMSYEAPALAMFDARPVPNAFPVTAAALRFPEKDRPGLAPVLVSLPASDLTFLLADDKQTYRADFSVIVRFRDATGEIVRKMSQHYELTGPADRLAAVKASDILFYREPELAPGVYAMETVVFDSLASRASVRFSTLEQPAVEANALRVSNLVIIGRGERLSEAERPAGSPFLVGDMLLYPNLGRPLRKVADKEVGFFFTVYPGATGSVTAKLELMQNGKLLAQSPLPLDKPDGTGRIQQVGRLPLEAIAPGTYDLRVVVGDGRQQVLRSVLMKVTG